MRNRDLRKMNEAVNDIKWRFTDRNKHQLGTATLPFGYKLEFHSSLPEKNELYAVLLDKSGSVVIRFDWIKGSYNSQSADCPGLNYYLTARVNRSGVDQLSKQWLKSHNWIIKSN